MHAPELVVEHRPVATAWTERGEVHVTRRLLELLDQGELEAVLAHELAHLARRDAPAMEICSGPSRMLLGFVTTLTPRLGRLIAGLARSGVPGLAMAVVLAAFCIPPAFAIGWISRLSVLVLSRSRELSADAAAAALTGRPSALASALLKLEHQRERTPRADLRQFYAQAVLCIVGISRRRLGRLISTHPSTAVRVRRLEQLEARMQAGPYAG
jgi:heat shock protein HtpX